MNILGVWYSMEELDRIAKEYTEAVDRGIDRLEGGARLVA